MNRRDFIVLLSASGAGSLIAGPSLQPTKEVTVVCTAVYNGESLVVFDDEPTTVFRFGPTIAFKRGEKVLVAA